MKYCCEAFIANVNEAGESGIRIRPFKFNDNYAFMLQSIFNSKERYFESSQAIKYCPLCGINLITIIEQNKDELALNVISFEEYSKNIDQNKGIDR